MGMDHFPPDVYAGGLQPGLCPAGQKAGSGKSRFSDK